MSINKVILVGNVGKDPEVRYLDSGVAVANFPFATSETYKNKQGEKVTSTEWHNIVMWRGLAEIVEKYVNKGSQLYIEGKIRTRTYDDREGNKRYITEIIGDNMQMLGRKSDRSSIPPPSEEDAPIARSNNQDVTTPSIDKATGDFDNQDTSITEGNDDLPF